MENLIKVFDKIIELSLYALILSIPFSKSGIEICSCAAILAWGAKKILSFRVFTSPRKILPRTPLNKPIAVFFVVSLLSTILSVDIKLSLEGLFFKTLQSILLFFVIFECLFYEKKNGELKNRFFTVMTIACLLLFADGIFQWFAGKDLVRNHTFATRLRASFSTANGFAAWLIVFLPVLGAMLFKARPPARYIKTKKSFILVLYFAGILLLAMTYSRGAWLGFILSLLAGSSFIFFVKGRRIKRYAVFSIASLILVYSIVFFVFEKLGNRLYTITDGIDEVGLKKYVWQEAYDITEDFPLFGAGPNTYSFIGPYYKILENTGYYPHNSYLHMAAETGILGLSAFLWILWRFFYNGVKKARENDDVMLLALIIGLFAFLTQSFFDTNLYALQLITLFWVMLAVATARMKCEKQNDVYLRN